jgi:type IV pilus assembly protein PilB
MVTIESPIEYRIEGVNQTQVDEEAGLTFATALGAVLLQDPDIIFVGDLSDGEIAATGMRAALKGKLVLSSVPAGDAVSAIDSLEHLSIDRSTIASALVGVVAQRLVRRLCVSCRRQYTPDAETLRSLAISDASAAEVVFYHAVGCAECHHTGYRGRTGVFEVMRVESRVRHLIARDGGADLIREAAISSGMISLAEDGIGKVKAGITSAEELLRVVNDLSQRRSLCPHCASPVTLDFTTCPHCGHRLGGCPKCARPLQPDWKYCPYCAAIMVSHKKKKRFKNRKSSEPTTKIAEFKNQNR